MGVQMIVENIKAIFDKPMMPPGKQRMTGIAKADLLVVQSRDAKGETEVSIILEAAGKRFGFPKSTYASLGIPHDWLDTQIERHQHPIKSRIRGAVKKLERLVS